MNTTDLANYAARAALGKKATRLILLDLQKSSDMCDMQLICSGQSNQQTKAIATAISQQLKDMNIEPSMVEGEQAGHWILMDYGPLLIHIFYDYVRDYYALEGLWPNAKFVDLDVH